MVTASIVFPLKPGIRSLVRTSCCVARTLRNFHAASVTTSWRWRVALAWKSSLSFALSAFITSLDSFVAESLFAMRSSRLLSSSAKVSSRLAMSLAVFFSYTACRDHKARQTSKMTGPEALSSRSSNDVASSTPRSSFPVFVHYVSSTRMEEAYVPCRLVSAVLLRTKEARAAE